MSAKYQVELVWNREFTFVPYGPLKDTVAEAVVLAKDMEESGDGERVKKTRVVDDEGTVVWAHGRLVKK